MNMLEQVILQILVEKLNNNFYKLKIIILALQRSLDNNLRSDLCKFILVRFILVLFLLF